MQDASNEGGGADYDRRERSIPHGPKQLSDSKLHQDDGTTGSLSRR